MRLPGREAEPFASPVREVCLAGPGFEVPDSDLVAGQSAPDQDGELLKQVLLSLVRA